MDESGSEHLARQLGEAREEATNWRLRYEREHEARSREGASLTQENDLLKSEIRKYEVKVESAETARREAEKALRERVQNIIRDGGVLLSREQKVVVLNHIPASETYAGVRSLLGPLPGPARIEASPASQPFRGALAPCVTVEDGSLHIVKTLRGTLAGVLSVDTFCFRNLSVRAVTLAKTTCRECTDRLREESS